MHRSHARRDAGSWIVEFTASLAAALSALGGQIDRGLDRMEGRG